MITIPCYKITKNDVNGWSMVTGSTIGSPCTQSVLYLYNEYYK
jgi:hypothetical protein